MIQTISRGWACLRNYGAGDLFFRLLHRLRLISVHHTFEIFLGGFEQILDVDIEKISKIGELRITFREIASQEIESLKVAEGFRYSETTPLTEDLKEQFRRGLRFFTVSDQRGVVIGVEGVHTEVADLVYVRKSLVGLPKGVVYGNAALIASSYRNRGIGGLLKKYMAHVLKQEGYTAMVTATFLENRGAARWHEKNHFKRWGRIRYIRLNGRDIVWTQLTEVGRQYPDLLFGGKGHVPLHALQGVAS